MFGKHASWKVLVILFIHFECCMKEKEKEKECQHFECCSMWMGVSESLSCGSFGLLA